MKDIILTGCAAVVFAFGYFMAGRLDDLLDGLAWGRKETGTEGGGETAFGLPKAGPGTERAKGLGVGVGAEN